MFLSSLATFISVKLDGRNRMRYQVVVSLAVPIAFAIILSAIVDALPFETLWRMMTPWLLLPLGITGWLGWIGSKQLDWHHPFRGFVITAAVLFVLCLMRTMGMTSDSDSDGEGSSFFMDPEKAQRAKETGEYVLYVLAAYAGLFFGFLRRGSKAGQLKAIQNLVEALTPQDVEGIVSTMGGYIADRHARPGRVADLPFSKSIIEVAFLKAIRDCTGPVRLERLKAVYITLDQYMLTDDDSGRGADLDSTNGLRYSLGFCFSRASPPIF